MAILAQLLDGVIVHTFELSRGETLVGRKPSNHVVIDDNAVSGQHSKISLQPNAYFADYLEAFIEDLGSTNGTYLNNQPVVGRQRLHHNDIISIAWNRFKYVDEGEQEMERTVHMISTRS